LPGVAKNNRIDASRAGEDTSRRLIKVYGQCAGRQRCVLRAGAKGVTIITRRAR
jgi:hypothetical protein